MNINEALNLLNLSQNVTKEEIKKAYKKMAIKYHPDRNPAGAEVMKAINAAFEFLSGLDGDTFTHTDTENAYNFAEELAEIITELKKLGCFWAVKKLKWYYRPAEHKSRKHRKEWDMEEIRNKYGSSVQHSNAYVLAAA